MNITDICSVILAIWLVVVATGVASYTVYSTGGSSLLSWFVIPQMLFGVVLMALLFYDKEVGDKMICRNCLRRFVDVEELGGFFGLCPKCREEDRLDYEARYWG